MTVPLLADLGAPELLIIFAVVVLLFGASKLPELARGSGRALRIFKAETKGLMDDDDVKTPEQRQIDATNRAAGDAPLAQNQVQQQIPNQVPVQQAPVQQAPLQQAPIQQAPANPDDTSTPPGTR